MSAHLILLPGMDGTGALFRPLAEAIGEKAKFDIVSYPSTEILDYDQLVEVVKKHLPTSESYFILAESFSGPVAMRIASEKPPNLIGLILVATFFRNPAPILRLVPSLVLKKLLLAPDWVIQRLLLGSKTPTSLNSEVTNCIKAISPEVLVARVRVVSKQEKIIENSSIGIPVLYLKGIEDALIGRKAAKIIEQKCQNFQFVEINGPHLLLQKEPQNSWKIIERFTRQHSAKI